MKKKLYLTILISIGVLSPLVYMNSDISGQNFNVDFEEVIIPDTRVNKTSKKNINTDIHWTTSNSWFVCFN